MRVRGFDCVSYFVLGMILRMAFLFGLFWTENAAGAEDGGVAVGHGARPFKQAQQVVHAPSRCGEEPQRLPSGEER